MRQRLKEIMSRLFEVPLDKIPDDAAINALKGWDSLGHISLMMAVEQEFGVALTTEAMQQALTLPALEDFVSQADKR